MESGTGAASPPRPALVGLLVWTLLVFALFAASLTLLSVAMFAHADARKTAAPEGALSYNPATGVASLRRAAVVQFASGGRPLDCTMARSTAGTVLCPQGSGAIEGSCDGGAAGNLLVTWRGTGWICPRLEPDKKSDAGTDALCCQN